MDGGQIDPRIRYAEREALSPSRGRMGGFITINDWLRRPPTMNEIWMKKKKLSISLQAQQMETGKSLKIP